MRVCGITAEYNPFHNGHLYQTAVLREQGFTHIVAVMGGNFSQRGTASALSKKAKAKAALDSGVDLVIELPVCCCLSGAEGFAKGGVFLLHSICATDAIVFGSECGDIQTLNQTAAACISPEVDEYIRKRLSSASGYAQIREEAVRELYGDSVADVLKRPNDILATEYIKAATAFGYAGELIPVKRTGAQHNSDISDGGIASASYIRSLSDLDMISKYVPDATLSIIKQELEAGRYPADSDRLSPALVSRLRMLPPEFFSELPDISEGLENRIYNAVRQLGTVDEIVKSATSKRHPSSRIRRILTCAAIGITAKDSKTLPQYIRPLGATDKGIELLGQISKRATLPLFAKSSQINDLDDRARRQFDLECSASDLYTLTTPTPYPCGEEMTSKFIHSPAVH